MLYSKFNTGFLLYLKKKFNTGFLLYLSNVFPDDGRIKLL